LSDAQQHRSLQPDYPRLFSVLLEIMASLSTDSFESILAKLASSTCQVLDADRATVFLVDEENQQIWSKVAQGATMSEIRVPLGAGIAGHVGMTGATVNIPDAYSDARFNQEVDRRTGYHTRSILCMPMCDPGGRTVGVFQVLNKNGGVFTVADEHLLAAFAAQASVAIQTAILNEKLRKRMEVSETLLRVMREVASELALDQLLAKIVINTSEVMEADRATLFLLDKKRGDLWSKVAQGAAQEIRVPLGVGIVGHVAVSGETVNIPDCYADSRFNKEVDKRTGYRTRCMLCMPLRDESGETIGVMQVLNKNHGAFTQEDEHLLNALGSQTAIAIQNSHLFEQVQFMRNYNESILRTMATGVITLDAQGAVEFCNPAATAMFGEPGADQKMLYHEFFDEKLNGDIVGAISQVYEGNDDVSLYQYSYKRNDGHQIDINGHAMPLRDKDGKSLGVVIVAEDITQEQKLMGTLCRTLSRKLAEEIMKDPEKQNKLGGTRSTLTVLFADIRSFTTISEQHSADEIVSMLNEYFSRMIEPIYRYDGIVDKFIGDAIMAFFGAPAAMENDALSAVRAAIEMRYALRRYNRYRAAYGQAPIEIGIGITKGDAISGNIGSAERCNYTVIGDTVNVASRLEGLTKEYDCKILFNEAVYQEVRGQIECVDLGLAKVKGKGESLRIFGVRDPGELRRHERLDVAFAVSYGVGDHLFSGQASDISEGGISIAATEMFPVGAEIEVHCRLREEWIKARGMVRRSRESGLGVQFIDVGEHEKECIRGYVLYLESQSVTGGAKPAMAAH
jgi:adenylate cyclase